MNNLYVINKYNINLKKISDDSSFSISDFKNADKFNFEQFIFLDINFKVKTIYILDNGNMYCINIDLISKKYVNDFFIGNIIDNNISYKINYCFSNLSGIILHNLNIISNGIKIDLGLFKELKKDSIKSFLAKKVVNGLLIKNTILAPSNLVITDGLSKIYKLLNNKLESGFFKRIYFEDIILSLIPIKFWTLSLFFLNSKMKFRIIDFFNTYNDIISLQIPVARSKFLKDLFESLLLQTNKNFNIIIGIDGYNEKQKNKIIEIIKKYEKNFKNFSYFINRKNLGVGKTRWKLLEKDKESKYIIFLDDDVFLDYKAIDNLYKKIYENKNMGLYSIENVDVKYNISYKDYIFKNGDFEQPGVFTNRERDGRLPVYVNQEETPIIFDRFYTDLLNFKYNKTFNNCSLDLFYNRVLGLICGNINIKGVYQFNRVGHKYHQTQEEGFLEKEFKYILFILKKISYINNDGIYYDILIKTQIPKQNELFTKKIDDV